MKIISKTCIALLITLFIGPQAFAETLRLATTTSTQNSGLLDKLLPTFQTKTGIEIHVIAVGTGKALRMGRDGDVDVVMVHAPSAEEKFVKAGYGSDRIQFMYNDFVIVGPPKDPADVKAATSVTEALQKIEASKAGFVSRGDDSGTHKKEIRLWKNAALSPQGKWYMEAGQGMGKVLQIAAETGAYSLTDRGTWLAYKGKVNMELLFAGDKNLNNVYGIIAVNPKKHTDTNYKSAKILIDWVASKEAQTIIKNYRLHGEALFVPLLLKWSEWKH